MLPQDPAMLVSILNLKLRDYDVTLSDLCADWDISEEEQVEGETVPIPEEQYIALLKTRGSEKLVDPKTASESEIAADSTQYVYNRDYFVGDYVTVEHKRFGMIQPKVQLIGMIEAFDQNGRSLTPTFRKE